jgi:putative oxidoreductase
MKRFLTGGAGGGDRTADFGLLLFRMFVGLALAFGHGLGKLPPSERFLAGVVDMGFPAPLLFGWAAGLSEFVGGLLIAAGLMTRPAAVFAGVTMVVAAFIRQAGDPFSEIEKALLFLAAMVLFLLMGAGRYSLDALLRRKR